MCAKLGAPTKIQKVSGIRMYYEANLPTMKGGMKTWPNFFKGKFGLVNMPIPWDGSSGNSGNAPPKIDLEKHAKSPSHSHRPHREIPCECQMQETRHGCIQCLLEFGGRSRHVGCFCWVVVVGPCSNIRFWVVGCSLYVSEKESWYQLPIVLESMFGVQLLFCRCKKPYWLDSFSCDTLNGPLSGFHWPQGWHDIVLFVGHSNLHLDLPLSLGGGHTPMDT